MPETPTTRRVAEDSDLLGVPVLDYTLVGAVADLRLKITKPDDMAGKAYVDLTAKAYVDCDHITGQITINRPMRSCSNSECLRATDTTRCVGYSARSLSRSKCPFPSLTCCQAARSDRGTSPRALGTVSGAPLLRGKIPPREAYVSSVEKFILIFRDARWSRPTSGR